MHKALGFDSKKIIASLICVLVVAQSLMAYGPESGFWSDRRRATQKQYASLGSGSLTDKAVGPQSLAAQFPVPERIRESISSSISRQIPEPLLKSNAAVFSALSPAYGRVRKFSTATNGTDHTPIVIHIQDVHRNAEAQNNIREVVSRLLATGQVGLLALEGATEKIDLQRYVDFPHPEAVRLAADYLLRENDISGPIHAALTAKHKLPPILGIDDPDLYAANVQAYRESAPHLDQTRAHLHSIQTELEAQKKRFFSPALQSFDKSVTDYRNGQMGLGPYVQALVSTAGAGTPSAQTFLKALALERALDYRQVELERIHLVDALTQRLAPSETAALLSDSLSYRAGQVGYAEFYGKLKNVCHRAGLKLSEFPAMDDYIRYVLLADSIDAEKLLSDLDALEKSAYARLLHRDEERELVLTSRRAWLSQQLAGFSMTPSGWAEYETIPSAERNPRLASFESFYREAHKRDNAMAHRLIAELQKSPGRTVAVLITGGYHAEGIAQQLNRQGIAVVSFVPKIEKVDGNDGAAYLSVFTQEKTPLEKLFQGEKLFLAQSPWKPSVRKALAPALVVLAVGLIAYAGGFDFSSAYTSLGGEGALSHIARGDGTIVAALATVRGNISVNVLGSFKTIRSVVWATVAEKRNRWVARALSARERRVGTGLAQKAEVVLLGGGSGMERMGQAYKAIHDVRGPVKALVSNLSQSGRSAALQALVSKDWGRWKPHFRLFLDALPRWITRHFDLVSMRTVPYMGYPMQALEGGISRPWLKALLSEEITDYSGTPSAWLDRLLENIQSREDYQKDTEKPDEVIEAIRSRMNAIPSSLQGLIHADTVRLDGTMVPRAQPLRNLVFLGALYRDQVVKGPGLLSRSAFHRMVSGLAEDLDSTVVPLSVGLETAWDVSLVGSDASGREKAGEKAITLRSEIGPLERVQLADLHHGGERGYLPLADPEALRAIREAEHIVLGPANLPTLVGVLAPAGILESLAAAKARGATVTWFFNPVQNRDTEGLSPAGLVRVLESSLSTPGRSVSLGNIFTDVVVNDPSGAPDEMEAFRGGKEGDSSPMTDPEKTRREAELVSGFWQDQTPEEIQVELEDLLHARVFLLPLAEVTENGGVSYPLHRLVAFLSLVRLYAAHGRLIGVFDKDDTTNKANKNMQNPMVRLLARALRAGFVFAPHTASSFEELTKNFRPLFLALMYTSFEGLRLPAYILKEQFPMIASIMDARRYEPNTGTYQQAESEDMFSTIAKTMENEAREKRESMEDHRRRLQTQAREFLVGVQGIWSGFEKNILAAENVYSLSPIAPILEAARGRMVETEWSGPLADALNVTGLSFHNQLALYLETMCERAVVESLTDEQVFQEMGTDFNSFDAQCPQAYVRLLFPSVLERMKVRAAYPDTLASKKREFDWPQTIREGLDNTSLSTRELIALWLEALLVQERARSEVYGARVERRMKAPEESSAADSPHGIGGILGNRRVQYVLRAIPNKAAQKAEEERVKKIVREAGIPMDAKSAGTSSINFAPRGQSKRDALFLLAKLLHLPIVGDGKRIQGLIFADDRPDNEEVEPAVRAVSAYWNAGISPPSYPSGNTVVQSPKAGPEGMSEFMEEVAVVLETMNPGVPVNFNRRPSAWAELMRTSVTGHFMGHLARGRGVFKMGGQRLSTRANALKELLAEGGMLTRLIGEAEKLKSGKVPVRYVIFAGVGGSGALGRMLDRWPSDPDSARIFPLEHIDPAEIERLKNQLIDVEANPVEKFLMALGSMATEEEVWKRARLKSALVVVAQGLSEEGNDAIKALTSLVGEMFGQVDTHKPSKHVFIFADPPVRADDRTVPEVNWQLHIGAQLIPLQGRLLKRDLHPGLPLAFLIALKNKSPEAVFEEAVKLNRKGEAQDGFVRLAAWAEGYVREGKNQMVLILPPDMEGMGPLTARSVEPSLLSKSGNSPQVAYGLPVNPNAYPSAKDAHTIFIHVRREGVRDENEDAVEELRQAGHPVAVITLPADPYVAFTVWMEGMFRFSAVLGIFEGKKPISTPEVPAYKEAVQRFKSDPAEAMVPGSYYEKIGLNDDGVFGSGRIQPSEVDALLGSSGITNPNAADRYAACLFLLHKQTHSDGDAIAEIRYFGAPSKAMAEVLKKAQTILSYLLKKIVRLSRRIHSDYMGSLARPIYGTPILMETLVWPASVALTSWKTDEPEVKKLLSGESLRVRQMATLEAFRNAKTPHILLTLPSGDETASSSLRAFFQQVEKRFNQFQKSQSAPPINPPNPHQGGQQLPGSRKQNAGSFIGRILLELGETARRMLDSIYEHFGLPGLSFGVVPPGPAETVASPSERGRDPMNFRHLPKNEILEVLRNDLGDNFPTGHEDDSISVKWPPWYDSETKEKEYPVPEICVRRTDGRSVSYFLKPSNFLVPTQIGLEMQRRLGGGEISVWSVPNWIVITDAGLNTITAHKVLTDLWEEAVRLNDDKAKETIREYTGQLNCEIGKLLGTAVILGYNDAYSQNVVFRDFRELESIGWKSSKSGFDRAVRWLNLHPPHLQLFDFEARQFLSVFHQEHYWEPGGVDYMILGATDAFGDLLRFSRDIGSLDETDVRKGFLDQMNNGLSLEEDLVDYLEAAIPKDRASHYFVPGFEKSFRDRLMDDPAEWYETLLADTVLFDYQPVFRKAGKSEKKYLKGLESSLKDGRVRRTANVFDLDGDPRALERLIPLVQLGRIEEVIVHGDVFDRGSNNIGCLKAMQELKALLGDRFIYILGNHEVMMIESLILKKQETLPIWLGNGGRDVLREFGDGALRLAEQATLKINELEPLADPEPHVDKRFNWRILSRWVRHLLHNAAIFGNYRVVDYEYELFLNDAKMKPVLDLAWWVLKNGRFHYVDDKGWIHLHAGLPLRLDKKPYYTALELAEQENRLAILLRYAQEPFQLDARRREAVAAMFHKLSGIFWVRKSFWIYRFFNPSKAERTQLPMEEDPKLRDRANTIAKVTGKDPEVQYQIFLRKSIKSEDRLFVLHFDPLSWEWMNSILQYFSPGAQGLMIGHNRVSTLHNVDNRFICADTGTPAVLLSGPEGIQFVPQNVDLAGGPFKTLLGPEEMHARAEADLIDSAKSAKNKEPLSLAFLITGNWRWGIAGLFVEWGAGVALAHALAGAFTVPAMGVFPAGVLALGAMALTLYAFSLVHAIVMAHRDRGEVGRGPPRSVWVVAFEFFRGFFPYLILPMVFLFAPAWGDVASSVVLWRHLVRDWRSKMGAAIAAELNVGDPHQTAKTILEAMPGTKRGTFDVESILGAIGNPEADLRAEAERILQSVSVEDKSRMGTLEGATETLLKILGIAHRSVALVPLSDDLLNAPGLAEMAKHAADLHGRAVFFVEADADTRNVSEALRPLGDRALLIRLEKKERLFSGHDLMLMVLQRRVPRNTPSVQVYLPQGYTPNDSNVTDDRFGKNSVRSMDILFHFDRLLELARFIAQQA